MTERELVISEEKHQELKDELLKLKTEKRVEVAHQIRDAKDYGDISENSEYEDAKNQQAFIEGRIAEIERILKKAKILSHNLNNHKIAVGSKVNLKDNDNKVIEYSIVSPLESNPSAGKISLESPLGQALSGRKKGETISVTFPSGKTNYKIIKVE